MRTRLHLALGAAVVGVGTLITAPAALAAPICDPYSGVCQEVISGGNGAPASGSGGGPSTVGGTVSGAGNQPAVVAPAQGVSDAPASLPFTGGEFILMSLLGATALAGGTVLVVGARRRTPAVA